MRKDEPMPRKGRQIVFVHFIRNVLRYVYNQISKGYVKYHTFLMTDNGRNVWNDAWQEYIDLGMYLTQAQLENQSLRKELDELKRRTNGQRHERNRNRRGDIGRTWYW